MKILLDECLTKKLKQELPLHEVYTVFELGISGIKNGKLLKFCAENNFDLLLTIDKNMAFQQNLKNFSLSIVVFDAKSSRIEELVPFIPTFNEKCSSFKKSEVYIISI